MIPAFTKSLCLCFSLCLVMAAAPAAEAVDHDVVVPIRSAVGADGQALYTITIRIGKSRPIEALLDTGSVGLRVLNTALVGSDVRPTSTSTVTVNAIGLELTGHVGRGTLTLGEAKSSSAIPFQVIETTACLTTSDGCDPERAAPGKFRFTEVALRRDRACCRDRVRRKQPNLGPTEIGPRRE